MPTEEAKARQRELMRVWRKNNKERCREYKRQYYGTEEGKQKRINEILRTLYGITLEQYNEILQNQGGKCAICGTTSPGNRIKRFNVDHDHSTGKIRGLLCLKCNRGIGFFDDDPQRLQSVVNYLKSHQEENASD